MSAGLAPPASARLEAVAPFGAPIFIFVARGDDATLLLPRDDRVLEHGKSDQVLEAVAGVPIGAADLRLALVGCPPLEIDAGGAKQFGAEWRLVAGDGEDVWLRRDRAGGRWRVVSIVKRDPDWRAEYREFTPNGLPRSVHFVSGDRKRFDLTLALSQVELNPALGAEVFRLDVPRDADPITLEELRRARPGVRED
jgi:hypothetical protein